MVKALLKELKNSNIQLKVKGDRLICRSLKGSLTPDILQRIKLHKQNILLELKGKQIKAENLSLINEIILGDCLEKLKAMPDNSVDTIICDPPYGIRFMGKDWDKAIPETEVWREGLRVLKPGGFAFILCLPRQDCLSHMISNIETAGFKIDFTSLYWVFAEGFTKRHNISVTIDKRECKRLLKERLGRKPTHEELKKAWKEYRDVIKRNPNSRESCNKSNTIYESGTVGKTVYNTKPRTEKAIDFEGASAGFQPKPAVEVIIVAMKPLDEKTYTDQALSNGKGVTWLSDGRIPYSNKSELWRHDSGVKWSPEKNWNEDFKRSSNEDGRFPANVLVSGEVLDDGKNHPGGSFPAVRGKSEYFGLSRTKSERVGSFGDNGGISRFFSLDAWWEKASQNLPENIRKRLPFICLPKASRAEKEIGLDGFDGKKVSDGRNKVNDTAYQRDGTLRKNTHPTVKNISLMTYLTAIGSHEGDIVLDPYCGTATTCIATKLLNRNYIGIEKNPEYHKIALARMDAINDINQGKIAKAVHSLLKIKNSNKSTDETREKLTDKVFAEPIITSEDKTREGLFGTKEWAGININIVKGCSHNCLYCYAKSNALRFKRLSAKNIEQWEEEKILQEKVDKGYRKRKGIVMFPSSHDITPYNLDACITVLEKLLKAENEVLIVSKPHLKCIGPILNRFEQYKDQILFRFTITATDNDLLSFWEPGAPSYEERFQCLKIAWHREFKTSVSVEPMLDPEHIDDLITNVTPLVTETIWIGLVQHLNLIKNDDNAVKEAIEKIKMNQTANKIRSIYERCNDNPKIRWKESIKKLLGLH